MESLYSTSETSDLIHVNLNFLVSVLQRSSLENYTSDNTTQHEDKTTQHETTRVKHEYNTTQHESTRVQYDRTQI